MCCGVWDSLLEDGDGMSRVRELHQEAMQIAQLALVARNQSDPDKAEELAWKAFLLEKEAADLIPLDESSEPTRSILYRSAASLAYQARNFEMARRMVFKGFSGSPPDEIFFELENLYEQVRFEEKLQQEDFGILDNNDVNLALDGRLVGYGTILYPEFSKRLENLTKLLDRTTSRLMKRDYQSSGSVAKEYKPFNHALQVPTPGSFSITIRLIRAEDQQQGNFFVPDAKTLIDEVITGIELVNQSEEEALRQRIVDPKYFRNFLSLTKDLAPDGEKITLVKINSVDSTVALTKHRAEIKDANTYTDISGEAKKEEKVLEGLLDYATVRGKEVAGLTDHKGEHYTIVADEGLDDVVRGYYNQMVVITGIWDGKFIHLTDIQPPS